MIFSGFENLLNRHRNRLLGNLIQGCEQPLVDLLMATTSVQALQRGEGIFGLEVGWRIIERQMAILANAYESNVHDTGTDFRIYLVYHFARIPRSIEQVIVADSGG